MTSNHASRSVEAVDWLALFVSDVVCLQNVLGEFYLYMKNMAMKIEGAF